MIYILITQIMAIIQYPPDFRSQLQCMRQHLKNNKSFVDRPVTKSAQGGKRQGKCGIVSQVKTAAQKQIRVPGIVQFSQTVVD